MFDKKKKLKFYPRNKHVEAVTDIPVPAARAMPEWFKQSKKKIDERFPQRFPEGGSNKTLKACMPFQDSLTAGYMITCPCDIVFVDPQDWNGQRVIWDVDWKVLEGHSQGQLGKLQVPDDYEADPLKWTVPWTFKTPPGYSCLFTHPLNRVDLPFYTMSGVVDTDDFDVTTNLPFLIKKGFMGKIAKGTPIAQVIPFKREHWISEKKDHDIEHDELTTLDKLRTVIDASYRLRWWKKKKYE